MESRILGLKVFLFGLFIFGFFVCFFCDIRGLRFEDLVFWALGS